MRLCLGLDVSTSITGISVIRDHEKFDPKVDFLDWHACELSKIESFWKKTDNITEALAALSVKFPKIDSIFIEEPMKRFAEGFSSAGTVSILQRMNGIVCYVAYKIWNVEPTYVPVSSARKVIGARIVQTKKDPQLRNAKKQTFDFILANDLSHVVWPCKKSGAVKDSTYDVVDSYVVARGGCLLNK
jgi:hypothetical protein